MSKKLLIDHITGDNGFETRKEAERAISIVTSGIASLAKSGETVQIRGFGKFLMKKRAGRIGRHPGTKEPVNIPAKTSLVFTEYRG